MVPASMSALAILLPTASFSAPAVRIVTFGDSLTAPRAGVITYSDLLSRNLTQQGIKVEVISARVRGDTSTRARARFAINVLARSPNLVIFQLGANDAAIDVWNMPPASHRRVSKSEYDSNLRYFVRNLREQSMRRYTHDAKSVGLAPEALKSLRQTSVRCFERSWIQLYVGRVL